MMEAALLALANSAEILYEYEADEKSAIDVLVSFQPETRTKESESHTTDSIKKLQGHSILTSAQHCLKHQRCMLATFIAFNITLEELKQKFHDRNQMNMLDSKLRMHILQRRFEHLRPEKFEPKKKIPKKTGLVPFPERQFRRRPRVQLNCQKSRELLAAR